VMRRNCVSTLAAWSIITPGALSGC